MVDFPRSCAAIVRYIFRFVLMETAISGWQLRKRLCLLATKIVKNNDITAARFEPWEESRLYNFALSAQDRNIHLQIKKKGKGDARKLSLRYL